MDVHPIGAWYSKPYLTVSNETKFSPWYRQGMSPKVSTEPVTIVIKNIQRFLLARGYDLPGRNRAAKMDGWFGQGTAKAVMEFQKIHKDPITGKAMSIDGMFGRLTSRAALFYYGIGPAAKHYDIDHTFLAGLVRAESGYDWCAHNRNDGEQSWGLVQINLMAHQFDLEDVLRPSWSLHWAAGAIRSAYNRFADGKCHSTVDPWNLAIAQHNSPRMARQWCESGEPSNWIQNYVTMVKMGY